MLFALISVVVVVFMCVEFEAVRRLVAKLFFGTLAVALLVYGACALQNAARAEGLPDNQYYKVVFADEVEELEDKLLLHGDDSNRIWDWYEEYPSKDEEFVSFEFDEELSNLALRWAQENNFFVQLNRKDRIVEGRIVVLTMRHSDDPNGDETMDSYFTEFVTR